MNFLANNDSKPTLGDGLSLSPAPAPLIEVRNVSVAWDGRYVLSNVSLTVNKGDFIAITGPNGGGKTTLLRVILRLLKPTSGSVHYCNLDTHDSSSAIGYLPQKNMIDAHFPITVSEVIESGLLAIKGIDKKQRNERRNRILDIVGLQDKRSAPIGTLSGGQLQRALLGRAIIGDPRILVLDEPLSYIDKTFEKQLYHLIEQLSHRCTILLVSHEMSTIAAMANRHLIVDGSLHECTAQHHYIRTDCQ